MSSIQKQSDQTRSQQQTGLTILSKDVILKEQDHKEVIKRIALSVRRLSVLYQIQGWSDENSVILAEWIFDNYKYESLEAVESCLANPPETYDEQGRKETNWRLTPDRVQKWMAVQLEKEAIKREKENEKLKLDFKEALPQIDYESYKLRIEKGEALKDEKSVEAQATNAGFMDEGYKEFKRKRAEQLKGKLS